MTKPQDISALSEQEKIEIIATKLMKWKFFQKKEAKGDCIFYDNQWVKIESDENNQEIIRPVYDTEEWNPYKNEDHWRECSKLIKGDIATDFLWGVIERSDEPLNEEIDYAWAYMQAELDELCDSLVSVLLPKKSL